MKFIKMKNWEEYQHYKDRSAPWIKLHKELLSSHFWVMGNDASKLLAICIMLLAQRNDNKIPADPEYIRRFGHLESLPDFKPLIDAQLIEIYDENECLQSASITLATCPPEENREEKNIREKKPPTFDPKKRLLDDGVDLEFVDAFLAIRKAKKKPLTLIAYNAMRREVTKAGWSMAQAMQVVCENSWQSFKAEYVAGKPTPSAPAIALSLDEIKAQRKAELAAAKAAYAEQEAKYTVPPMRAHA